MTKITTDFTGTEDSSTRLSRIMAITDGYFGAGAAVAAANLGGCFSRLNPLMAISVANGESFGSWGAKLSAINAPAGRFFSVGDVGAAYDIGVPGTVFQDAAGTVPVTGAGQPVGRVLDISGGGRHASQTVSAARPTYQVDSGGRPYLQFDGVDDLLQTSAMSWGTATVTVVAAIRRQAGTGARQVAGFGNTSSDAASWGLLAQSVTGDPAAYGTRRRGVTGLLNFDSPNTWPGTETAVITMVQSMSAPLARLRRNGVLDAESATAGGTGTFGTWPIDIGGRGNGTTLFSGRIYGLVAVNKSPDASQILLMEKWMAAKCGVTI